MPLTTQPPFRCRHLHTHLIEVSGLVKILWRNVNSGLWRLVAVSGIAKVRLIVKLLWMVFSTHHGRFGSDFKSAQGVRAFAPSL